MGARFGRLGGVHTWSEDGQATMAHGRPRGSPFRLLGPSCSLSCFEGSMSIACVGRCGVRPPRVVRHIRRRVGVISEIGKDQGLGKLVSHLAQYHGTLRPSNNLAAFQRQIRDRTYTVGCMRLIERLVYEEGLVYEVCTRLVRPTVLSVEIQL